MLAKWEKGHDDDDDDVDDRMPLETEGGGLLQCY